MTNRAKGSVNRVEGHIVHGKHLRIVFGRSLVLAMALE
jgi:hypothetical protein